MLNYIPFFSNKCILKSGSFLLFTFIFSLFTLFSYSQNKSTKGKDFWFGFEDNRDPPLTMYDSLYAYITADTNANCTISYSGKTYNFVVAAGTTKKIILPEDTCLNTTSEQINNKLSVHIVSDVSVSVFILNYNVESTDAAVVFPTPLLGNEYYTFSITPAKPFQDETESEFLIIGVEDNTKIQITPAAVTFGGLPANVPYTITLNKGDAYQVKSQTDLTGSHIKILQSTCGKFAVFSGNRWTKIPTNGGYYCCNNHLLEEMTPVNTWGNKIISAPYKTRSADLFRVMASKDNTVLQINGVIVTTLNKGQYYETTLSSSNVFQANNPICVMQYSRSQETDNVVYGDPMMILLSPVEQSINHIVFNSSATNLDFNEYYLNLVTSAKNINLITLDGISIGSSFLPVPSAPGYSYADITINSGNHILNSDSGFIAYVYGFGYLDAYGYIAGASLENLSQKFKVVYNKDTILNSNFNKPVCLNDSVGFIAANDTNALGYIWNFGDLISPVEGQVVTHSFKTPGKYTVQLTIEYACDSDYVQMQIIVGSPSIILLKDTTVCKGQTAKIFANGYNTYKWSDGSIANPLIVTPQLTTTYYLTATNTTSCSSHGSVVVTINTITVTPTSNSPVCEGDTLELFASFINNATYEWNGPDNFTSSIQNPVIKNTSTFSTGTYTVIVTNNSGCSDTTNVIVTLNPTPSITVSPNPATICSGNSVSLTASGANTYSWSPTVGLNTTNGVTVTANPTTTTTYTVTGTLNECSDTANVIVTVNPLPSPSITYAGSNPFCHGASLTLETTTAYSSYQWMQGGTNFDGETNSTYSATSSGTYTIIVSDKFGCKNSDSINISQFPIPVLNLGKNTTICQGTELILNPHNDTVSYTWNNNSHNNTLQVNKSGIYSVTITDKYGCKNSDSINISQYPVSYLNLGKDTTICKGCSIVLNAGNNFKEYKWKDGSNSPTYVVKTSGTYWVNVTDQYGCKYSDTIIVKEECDSDLFVPNVFTPNGDNINDIFKVVAPPCFTNFNMKIFNRWGALLFETNDINKGWDGNFRNKNVPEGVYFYVITYYNISDNSSKLHKNGTVTLLR